MPQWWEAQGFWISCVALLVVALGRGQLTYWVARLVTERSLARSHPTRGWQMRGHSWLQGDGLARGRGSLNRWGLVVIPLCYLTVGFQTLVLAAAGVMRIRWGLQRLSLSRWCMRRRWLAGEYELDGGPTHSLPARGATTRAVAHHRASRTLPGPSRPGSTRRRRLRWGR